MKKLLILATVLLTFGFTKAQSVQNDVADHVFVMADESGTPLSLSGQHFYLAFYANSKINMLVGRDLSAAISGGATKSGTWYCSSSKVWFVWKNGERSKDWYYSYSTTNLSSGSSFLRNLGGF